MKEARNKLLSINEARKMKVVSDWLYQLKDDFFLIYDSKLTITEAQPVLIWFSNIFLIINYLCF